jgi:2-keto-3-deoxy-6-phosphogluconate aldolase
VFINDKIRKIFSLILSCFGSGTWMSSEKWVDTEHWKD